MTTPTTTTMGLPCRNCRGAPFFAREMGSACPACGGKGHGLAIQLLPLRGYLAEITPGLAGWSWTILREGTPVDGGIRAAEQDAITAVTGWLDTETAKLADTLALAVLLSAVAEFGMTHAAVAAAFAAVALSDAFENDDQETPA